MKCPHCGEWIDRPTRADDHHTSKEAAEKMRITAENIRGRVLVAMFKCGQPMTDEEIDADLRTSEDQAESSFRRRRTDLTDMGLVEWSGKDRRNSRGNKSKLWTLTLLGMAEAGRLIRDGAE